MIGIEELKETIEKHIRQLEFKNPPAELYNPIKYTINSNGKRIRPVLTLLVCQMFCKKIDKAISPALGLEVFHNFTLLHDDIMDNAPVRRGLPTVHEKWDANTAILSGDTMMIEAYKLISMAPDYCLRSTLEVFSKTASQVCEGQMFDMQFEKKNNVSEAEYIEMIRLKTSVLLAASLKIGAIIAKAPQKQADLLYEFGINLGLAFQLKDDWLDVYSDPKKFGKKTGGDIVENKKTYLLIKAFEKADNNNKKHLISWINKTEFKEAEKIASVKNIYNELNISEITLKKAEYYSQKAFDCLRKVDAPNRQKQQLTELTKYLLGREK